MDPEAKTRTDIRKQRVTFVVEVVFVIGWLVGVMAALATFLTGAVWLLSYVWHAAA